MDLTARFLKARKIFEIILNRYVSRACPCAFPRFVGLVGVDCAAMGAAFKCYDTELMIALAQPFFLASHDLKTAWDSTTWLCKTCGSTFYFQWDEFSIHLERTTLKARELKAPVIGKPILRPIPLFVGLAGHRLPAANEAAITDWESFARYYQEEES